MDVIECWWEVEELVRAQLFADEQVPVVPDSASHLIVATHVLAVCVLMLRDGAKENTERLVHSLPE